MLKIICSRKKGPHIETALNIAKTLVEGTLQHGLTTYMWTSDKNSKSVDVVINQCYRTATGALKATPIDALRTEAGYLPFKNIGERRAISLGSKAITDLYHPLHSAIKKNLQYARNIKNKTISALNNIALILPFTSFTEESHVNNKDKPPWALNNLPIDTSLAKYKKDSTPARIFQMLHKDIIDSIKPNRILYTDGSSTESYTSYAVTELMASGCTTTLHQGLLPVPAGNYIAELAGLKKAMQISRDWSGKTLICTDSLGILNGV